MSSRIIFILEKHFLNSFSYFSYGSGLRTVLTESSGSNLQNHPDSDYTHGGLRVDS
jgi:hypothetical protein